MARLLRPSLRYCRVADRAVFLDLESGRYYMLASDLERDFFDMLEGHVSASSLERLTAAAILAGDGRAVPPPPPRPALPEAQSSLYDSARRRAALPIVLETIVRQQLARRSYARRHFGDIVAELGCRDPCPGKDRLSSLEPLVAALIGAERIVRRDDDCLAIGTAMSRMLARRRVAHAFVIGVTLPFAAHCWVQAGPTVLTDSAERVARFTPLLVR